MDIGAFLRRYPPFDGLSEERLRAVVRATQIEHFAAGTVILRQAGEPASHLAVVRKGEVELLDGGLLLDLLGEGEVFGQFSLMARESPTLTVRAAEDTLCYLIDASVADDILESSAGVAFMVSSMRRRMRRAVDAAQPETPDPQLRPIGELVRRPAVTVRPGDERRRGRVADGGRAGVLSADRGAGGASAGASSPTATSERAWSRRAAHPETPVEEVATFPVVTLAVSRRPARPCCRCSNAACTTSRSSTRPARSSASSPTPT